MQYLLFDFFSIYAEFLTLIQLQVGSWNAT